MVANIDNPYMPMSSVLVEVQVIPWFREDMALNGVRYMRRHTVNSRDIADYPHIGLGVVY